MKHCCKSTSWMTSMSMSLKFQYDTMTCRHSQQATYLIGRRYSLTGILGWAHTDMTWVISIGSKTVVWISIPNLLLIASTTQVDHIWGIHTLPPSQPVHYCQLGAHMCQVTAGHYDLQSIVRAKLNLNTSKECHDNAHTDPPKNSVQKATQKVNFWYTTNQPKST